MEIQVNGDVREFPAGLTLEGLVVALELQPARVAIELNRSVVRRNQWPATTLHEGDRVEIVHFVGGGSEPIIREGSLRQRLEAMDKSKAIRSNTKHHEQSSLCWFVWIRE